MKKLMTAFILLGVAAAARAEDAPRAHIGVFPGKAVMVGTTKDSQSDAFAVYWSLDYDVTKALSLGGDLGYIDNSRVQHSVNGVGFTSDVDTGFFQLTGNAKLFKDFGEGSVRVRPYAVAGGGWYQTFGRSRTVQVSNQPVTTTIRSKTRPGVQAGAGARARFGPRWGLGIDARFHSVLGAHDKPFQFVTLSGGILFSFG